MNAPSLPRLVVAALALVSLAGAALAVPLNFDTGTVSINQTSATTWTPVTFARTFASPPVVVAGPATRANTAPLVVRVRNVTTTGFDIALDEWDYLDGVHPAETVHWFALTPGVHQLGTQRWEAGRRTGVNRTVGTQTLTGFTAAPVVLAQLETTTNTTTADGVRALKARLQNVTAASFQVGLETEAANSAVTLTNETVGYIAVSQGKGYLDGRFVHAVRTAASITQAFSTVTFPEAATTVRFLGQTQTRNDAETGDLRMGSLGTASVQLLYAEEASTDANLAHTAEEVGYLVSGTMPGESAAKITLGILPITQTTASTWTPVPFGITYTNPVVVMGPVWYASTTAVSVRIRNLTGTGCEVQLDEWDHADGIHSTTERLYFIVMEQGSYAVGGALWQAGRTDTTGTGASTTFTTAYASAPAVLAQVGTWNDAHAVTARVGSVTATNFNVELDESEIDATAHASETVHWIAVPPGSSNLFSNGLRYHVGSGTTQTHAFSARTFGGRMHADPLLFAALQTKLDPDPATLRWRYLFADAVEMAAQEDGHPAQFGEGAVDNTHLAETVAYLVVQGAADTDEDGAPNAWETSVGLNPNSAADGALDPDGDLLTNQQEYHNRIDFVTSSSHTAFTGGTLTVSRIADAFERDDILAATPLATRGRFRVNRTGGRAPLTVAFTLAGTASTDTTRAPASPADYAIEDSAGTALSGSIALATNAQSVDVYVDPVQDTLDEYVEGLRLTVSSNANWVVGAPSSNVIILNDALDVPGNEKLFVGVFLPQGAAVTTASGVATMLLNGPNNRARVSTEFNGLTTPQLTVDGSHIHYGSTTDKIFGEDPTPAGGWPTGPLVDETWPIADKPPYKAQQIIDALYRKVAGEFLYINVHTSRYSSGEIRADLVRQDNRPYATPPPPPPLEDLTSTEEVKRECARFLTQATFGPSADDIDALYNAIAGNKLLATNRLTAFTNWINTQFNLPQTSLYDYHAAANKQEWELWGQSFLPIPFETQHPPGTPQDWLQWTAPGALNKESFDPDRNNRRRGWWTIANRAKDQLRQRAAFALEQIFVISDREGTLLNRAFGHSRYYDLLGDVADGTRSLQPANDAYTTATGVTTTVRHLLEDLSKSPMMGKYLSHLQNEATYSNGPDTLPRTADDILVTSPDENYAREIMQLFSIGLLKLNPDGSLKLGSDGKPRPTYTNDDIKGLARVFTGWAFAWKAGPASTGYVPSAANTNFDTNGQNEYFHPGYENPMTNFDGRHDHLAKVVLGVSLRAQNSGEADLQYAKDDLTRALNAIYAAGASENLTDTGVDMPYIAPFLSRLLIQRFVTSNPSRGYIYRVAEAFRDSNGAATGGARGHLRTVLRTMLLDYEARSMTFVNPQNINGNVSVNQSYGKAKEPIIRYLQVERAFGGKSQLPVSALQAVAYGYPQAQYDNLYTAAQLASGNHPTRYRYGETDAVLGQTPNHMPSVFNWYLPNYAPPGVVGGAGLFAPELQIMTENLVISALNYHRTIEYQSIIDTAATATGQNVSNLLGDTGGLLDNVFISLKAITDDYMLNGPTAPEGATQYLVNKLDAILTAGALKARYPYVASGTDPRSIIIDALDDLPAATSVATYGNRVRAAVYLITSSPEFIVQK